MTLIGVNTKPSLIVGLGSAGIRCLELIKQRIPALEASSVQYLGIRTQVGFSSEPLQLSDLGSENLIEIPWDHERARRLAESTNEYGWWLDNEAAGHAERSDARMAFHVMRNFYRDSRIEAHLKRIKTVLKVDSNNSMMLFMVSSLCEVESAVIGELAFEILQQIGISHIPVRFPCLLVGSTKDDQDNPSWVSAALREMDRFTQKWQIFHRDGDEIVIEHELFTRMMLLEDERCLPALADQIAGLVQKEAALNFSNDYGNLPLPADFSMTIGRSWTYYVPVNEIRRACAARLLKEELFDSTLFSEGRLHALVKEFLENTDSARIEWGPFRRLAAVLQGKRSSEINVLIQGTEGFSEEVFAEELCRYLNSRQMTNLQDAIKFLDILEKDLVAAINENAHMAGLSDQTHLQLPLLRAVIGGFRDAAAERMDIWKALASQTDHQHKLVVKELNATKQPARSGRALLRDAVGYGKQELLENYFQELKVSPERWLSLVEDVRNLMSWQWVRTKGQAPYLRCRVGGTVYTEGTEIFSSIWKQACQITELVAESETVFMHLGRLSAHQINAIFDAAPASLPYDPLPSAERRFHQYLIGARDPMIHDWMIKPDIQICQTSDNKRLTYAAFEYNLPIKGANLPMGAMHDSVNACAFPNEQYALKIETDMKALRLDKASGKDKVSLPSQLVRVMHCPADFERVMNCIFWGWVTNTAGSQWMLDPNDGREPIHLGNDQFPAMSMEDAVLNFLVRIPLKDLNRLHPLCRENYPMTMTRLDRRLEQCSKIRFAQRAKIHDRLQENIELWKHSQKPFDRGVAIYQTYLLALDRKKK